jgi:uncharacterized protein YegL
MMGFGANGRLHSFESADGRNSDDELERKEEKRRKKGRRKKRLCVFSLGQQVMPIPLV